MVTYKYRAQDENGKAISGTMQATDELDLHERLKQEKKYLIQAKAQADKVNIKRLRSDVVSEFAKNAATTPFQPSRNPAANIIFTSPPPKPLNNIRINIGTLIANSPITRSMIVGPGSTQIAGIPSNSKITFNCGGISCVSASIIVITIRSQITRKNSNADR